MLLNLSSYLRMYPLEYYVDTLAISFIKPVIIYIIK